MYFFRCQFLHNLIFNFEIIFCTHSKMIGRMGWVLVFNVTVNNISAILAEESGVTGENHRPVASN
jgi:hypothetical protein